MDHSLLIEYESLHRTTSATKLLTRLLGQEAFELACAQVGKNRSIKPQPMAVIMRLFNVGERHV